jgi:hypothetical protein
MDRLLFVVRFFTGDQETYNLNEGVLITVLVSLIIALVISFFLAKKNHLYTEQNSLDDIGEGEIQ